MGFAWPCGGLCSVASTESLNTANESLRSSFAGTPSTSHPASDASAYLYYDAIDYLTRYLTPLVREQRVEADRGRLLLLTPA